MRHLLATLAFAAASVCSAATLEVGGKFSVTYQPEQWTVGARTSESGQQGLVLSRPDGTKLVLALIPLASNPAPLTDAKARASFMRGMGNEKISSVEAEARIRPISAFGRPAYELTGVTELNGKMGSYRAVMVPHGTDAIALIFVTPAPDAMSVPALKAIWDGIKVLPSAAPVKP